MRKNYSTCMDGSMAWTRRRAAGAFRRSWSWLDLPTRLAARHGDHQDDSLARLVGELADIVRRQDDAAHVGLCIEAVDNPKNPAPQ